MSLFFESWINGGLIFLTDLKITNSELDEVYIFMRNYNIEQITFVKYL